MPWNQDRTNGLVLKKHITSFSFFWGGGGDCLLWLDDSLGFKLRVAQSHAELRVAQSHAEFLRLWADNLWNSSWLKEESGPCPVFSLYPGIRPSSEEKSQENVSQSRGITLVSIRVIYMPPETLTPRTKLTWLASTYCMSQGFAQLYIYIYIYIIWRELTSNIFSSMMTRTEVLLTTLVSCPF